MSPLCLQRILPYCAVLLAPLVVATQVSAGKLLGDQSRDFLLTVQARRLLLDDPQLGPLNLGLNVVDGVAILWGPVPNAALSFRAEQRLRAMIELAEVRNQLHVTDEETRLFSPPSSPHFLPDRLPPIVPQEPSLPGRIKPLIRSDAQLIGKILPIEPVTVHASPAPVVEAPTVRVLLLGTIRVP